MKEKVKALNPNYDFNDQKEPKKRMGQGDHANLPPKPMMKDFSRNFGVRSGVVNDFTCDLDETSGIDENHRRGLK